MIMKMPKWLKILMWCSFGFTMTAFAVSWWFTDQVYKGRCSTQECIWYWNASNWVALGSMWVMFGLGILYAVYVIVFRRAELNQRWQAQRKMPVWFWVLYCTGFTAYLVVSQYSRQHEEFRSFGTILFSVFMLFFMVPICLFRSQEKPRWTYLLAALLSSMSVYSFYTAWDSIGTSDLRYCLGQTYFQRVPVQSVGCEIIKAIPTPRYFAGRECPTADLFAGCKSDEPYSFQSYNQRRVAGIVTDEVPLPWNTGPRPGMSGASGGECVARDPTTGASVNCRTR